MTQTGMTQGNQQDWKVRALNKLWAVAATNESGLLVTEAGVRLREVNIHFDWSKPIPQPPEELDMRKRLRGAYQYVEDQPLRNMREWLQAHYPVYFTGSNDNTVLFLFRNQSDYAAAMMFETIIRRKGLPLPYESLLTTMAENWGLDENAVKHALEDYPAHFGRTPDGSVATLQDRLCLPMPEGLAPILQKELISAIKKTEKGFVLQSAVPAVVPATKHFFGKGGLSSWLETNCPALEVVGLPENDTTKIVRVVSGAAGSVRAARTAGNPISSGPDALSKNWRAPALQLLWDAAHRPTHTVPVGARAVETQGLVLHEVEDILKEQGISWRLCRQDASQTMEEWLENSFPVCLHEVEQDGCSFTLVIFQFVSLTEYAACMAYEQLKNVADSVAYRWLESQLYISYGLTREMIKEAFERYEKTLVKEQVRDLIKCRSTREAPRIVPEMSAELHDYIEQQLKKLVLAEPTQMLPLARIHLLAPWISRYHSGLKQWITTQFPFEAPQQYPDMIRICDDNRWRTSALRDQLARFAGLSARISELPELAKAARFDLQDLIGERTMEQWLEEFRQETGAVCTKDGESIYIPAPEGAYPKLPVVSHLKIEDEARQAQNFCFFPWDALSQLLNRSGNADKDAYRFQWQRYFCTVLAEALSGVNGEISFDETRRPIRAVLAMRMSTPEGEPLYAVMEENPPHQPNLFRLLGVVSPGTEDEDGLGQYLRESFGLTSSSATQQHFANLAAVVSRLTDLQEQLLRETAEAAEAVRNGLADIPAELDSHMHLWTECLQDAENLVISLGWRQDFEERLTLSAIRAKLQTSTLENQMLDDAKIRFDAMVEEIDQFLETRPYFGVAAKQCREQMLTDRRAASCSRISSRADILEFRELLEPYAALRALAQADLEQLVSLQAEQQTVCSYFKLLPFIVSHFIGTANKQFMAEPPLARLSEIDEIAKVLDSVISQIDHQEQSKRPHQIIPASTLFAQLSEQGKEHMAHALAPIFPENELEAMIVRGEMNAAAAWIREQEALPEEQKRAMLEALKAYRSGDVSLSLIAIGRRLLHVVGNRNQSAERYLLTACLQSRQSIEEAKQLLLDIYRSENRAEAFSFLFHDVQGLQEIDNCKYYLQILCDGDYADMRSYLNQHIYLMYDERCLDKVRQAAENAQDTAFVRMLEEIKAIGELAEDELTNAIRMGRLPEAEELVNAGKVGDRDMARLQRALSDSDALPMGTDDASAGCRLYMCQGNWRRIAEKYLWDALASGERAEYSAAAVQLTQLLAEESRWMECRMVYEYYSRECDASDEARRAYLVCLLNTNPAGAMEIISASMLDVLNLYLSGDKEWQLVTALKDSSDSRIAKFFDRVVSLCANLNNEFYRSVILPGRNLREMLAQPERVRDLGFSEKEEERMKLLRRTNDYPREMDPASIAERTYRFMGCRGGVAEAFASFAMPKPEMAELLRKIYLELDEQHELLDLMRSAPALRNTYRDEYCRLLLAHDELVLLRDAFSEYAPDTVDQRVIAQILSVRQDGAVNSDFDRCSAELMQCDAELVTSLFSALGKQKLESEIYRLASANIEKMLNEWPVEAVLGMLTGDGALDEPSLKNMQEKALENDCQVLAIVLWSHLKIGDLKELADEAYNQMMRKSAASDAATQTQLLAFFRKVFPDHSDHLVLQGLIIELRQQFQNSDNLDQLAAGIADKLKEVHIDTEHLNTLLQAMPPALLQHEAIMTCLSNLASNTAMCRVCLNRYHEVALTLDIHQTSRMFADYVTGLYLQILAEEELPHEMLTAAAEVCARYAATFRTENPLLCTACMEMLLGREAQADFILHEALSVEDEDSHVSERFHEAASMRWPTGVPTLLTLFQQVLVKYELDELLEYCAFCSQFVQAGDVVPVSVNSTETLLTDAECDKLLYSLFANLHDSARWTACADILPMQGAPHAQGRLKLFSCRLAPEPRIERIAREQNARWRACAEFCAERALDDLLLETLLYWAEHNTKIVKQHFGLDIPGVMCQFIISFDKENGGLPASWREDYALQLRTLHERLMKLIQPTEGALQRYAIIACSIVATVSTDPSLLETLLTDMKQILLEVRPNQTAALIARLLLAKRFEEAHHLLNMLMDANQEVRFQPLLESIHTMDADDLAVWSMSPCNQKLLEMMLPNGEMPPVEVVVDWCMEQIHAGRFDTGLELCRNLCHVFPDNRAFRRLMFYMLKNCGMERAKLKLMHETLLRIIRNTNAGDSEMYESRTQKDFAYLLAALNCVLMDLGETDSREHYDFSMLAGDYLRSCSVSDSADDVISSINGWQMALTDVLRNQQQEERERICRVIISWVTGDWFDVLMDAWHDTDRWIGALKIVFPVKSYGFARSVVRFLYELPASEWNNAMAWVNTFVTQDRLTQMKAVELSVTYLNRIGDQEAAKAVMGDILSYPLEEAGMCMQMLNSILNPTLLANMDTARFYATAMLSLMASPGSIHAANVQAYASYRDHEDRKAAATYYALVKVVERSRIIPPLFRAEDPRPVTAEDARGWVQRFKFLRYLTILLADDPQLYSDSMDRDLRNGNYFNLVLNLLCTERANEALLLRSKLPREFRPVVDVMLVLIDPLVQDSAKVQYVNQLQNEYIRMGALFLMTIMTQQQPTSCYINDRMVAMACRKQYEQLKSDGTRGELIYWKNMRPKWKIAAKQIQPPEDEADDVEEQIQTEATEEKKSGKNRVDAAENVIRAANELLDIMPVTEEEAEETDSPENYARISDLTAEDRRQKLEMSLQLYRHSLSPRSDLSRIDWLTRYCLDRFRCSKEPDNETLQLALLVAPAMLYCDNQLRIDYKNQAVSILRNLLRSRYTRLREQLAEYQTYKSGYIALRDMLTDEESIKVFQGIFKVIEMLISNYERLSSSDTEQMREVLREAETMLHSIRFLRMLGDVTGDLRNMVLNEFNQLDALPRLRVRVLNQGKCQCEGRLFGQVDNLGRSEARDIQLRASFGDGHPTEPYRLPVLSAGASAVFAIGYETEESAEKLPWNLECSCMDRNGTRLHCQPCSGELELTDEDLPFFTDGRMNVQTISDFKPNADGTDVENPDFVGRESEKRRLRGLYDGLPFASCRNGLAYGIRRSGKTSLLHYITAYLNTTRKDLIAVFVDGQGAHTTIRSAFVEAVLSRLKQEKEIEEETYSALMERWVPASDPNDIDPRRLMDFYCEVKDALDGRGLVMIIDEFDRLLEKLDGAQVLETSFYPVLSSMLCDAICARTVHFLFCGSKELKIEMNKDRQVTQVFQRIGETDIMIGAMPKQEMIEMVRKPYSIYPEVVFTDEALEWLWNLVGGLVWFSKLVAKQALFEAKEDRRSVVYPMDIFQVVCKYANTNNMCKQFYEGFRDDEKAVVEALGNAAVRPGQYVSITQVVELLQAHLSRERIERALRNMIALEMVEVNRQNANLYRFRVDLYRRYFREQTEIGRLLGKTNAQDVSFRIIYD